MAKRVLSLENKKDQVFVGGQSSIYGGYIYNVSVSLGFSEDKTTINVSVVSEDGEYDIQNLRNNLSTSIATTISFGGNDGLLIDPVYLYSYEIQKNESTRILQLTYVDGSILLDKVWVGKNYDDGIEFEDSPAQRLLSFEVGCQPCPGATERRIVPVRNLAVLQNIAKINQTTIDREKGGYIILGDQDFEENTCAVPTVSYNFTQLKDMLEVNGIIIEDLPDLNPDYRNQYAGTLRSVLSSWCSDFGHTFYWNSIKPVSAGVNQPDIIGLDLSNPKINIDAIKSAFESLDANRSVETVISSINEKYSLENTKKVYHLSSFKRQRKTETPRDVNLYVQNQVSCILPSQLSRYNTYRFGRTYEQFITSCMLATISDDLRDIYNYKLFRNGLTYTTAASDKFFNTINSTPIQSQVVGFDHIDGFIRLSEEDQNEYFGNFNLPFATWLKDGGEIDDYPLVKRLGYNKTNNPPVEFLVGVQNDEAKKDLVDYERAVGEFIGRYYKVNNDFYDYTFCGQEEFYNLKVSTVPQIEEYNKNSDDAESNPFTNLIKDAWNNVVGRNQLVFERTPVYGGDRKLVLEEILGFDSNRLAFGKTFKAVDVLKSYMPESQFADDSILEALEVREDANFGEVLRKYGKSITFYAAPKIEILNAVISISTVSFNNLVENTKEDWSSSSANSQSPADCETICEVNLIDDICKCAFDVFGQPLDYQENSIPPYEGLYHRNAPFINIRTNFSDSTAYQYYQGGQAVFDPEALVPINTNTRSIIAPTQSDYFMYFSLAIQRKYTMPSILRVEGSIGDASGLASIEVFSEDITQKIETYYDSAGNQLINVFTPGVDNDYIPRDPEAYHNLRTQSLPTSVQDPEHTLSLNLIGLDSSYLNYLDPKSGLISFDINYGQDGLVVDLQYSNRPPQLPQPDVVSKRIGPRLTNYNANRL